MPDKLACPTCGLRFHGLAVCRRCGSELALLMETARRAWRLRDEGRRRLLEGRFTAALEAARRAQGLHATPYGRLLERVALLGRQERIPLGGGVRRGRGSPESGPEGAASSETA